MRLIFNISILLIFFIVPAKAQDSEVILAEKILDKVSEKTQNYKSIEANFTFTVNNLQTQETESFDGSILIKGEKFKIDLMDLISYNNGETLWMFIKELNEVTVSDPDIIEEETLNPANIFSIYKEGFKYMHAGTTSFKGKTADIIDLFPEDRNQPFTRIKLYVYKDDLHFAKLEQIGKDGINYTIDILQMKVNVPADDNVFNFDPKQYPGIEIIDLR